MKVKTWLRNITTDIEFVLHLPVSNLEDILDGDCEYIIMECEVLDPSEFDSIKELNDFLAECNKNGIKKETLEILSTTYLYGEVTEMVQKKIFRIVDFEAVTSDWYGGNGGDLWNDSHKGMCLFDTGNHNPFKFRMNEHIYDWIDWESVWIDANINGWRAITANGKPYLVCRKEKQYDSK